MGFKQREPAGFPVGSKVAKTLSIPRASQRDQWAGDTGCDIRRRDAGVWRDLAMDWLEGRRDISSFRGGRETGGWNGGIEVEIKRFVDALSSKILLESLGIQTPGRRSYFSVISTTPSRITSPASSRARKKRLGPSRSPLLASTARNSARACAGSFATKASSAE